MHRYWEHRKSKWATGKFVEICKQVWMSNKHINSEKCLLSSSSLYSSVSLSAWQVENLFITTVLLPSPNSFCLVSTTTWRNEFFKSSMHKETIFREAFTRNFLICFLLLWHVLQQLNFSFRKFYCYKVGRGFGVKERSFVKE